MLLLKYFFLIIYISFSLEQAIFPNIGYLGSGYDIIYGNPHSALVTEGPDPGFRSLIFQFNNYTSKTPDGKYKIPNSVNAENCNKCSLTFDTSFITGEESYFTSLLKDISVDNEVIWKFSFSASEDYKRIYEFSTKYNDIFSSSLVSCCVYTISFKKNYPLSLSTDFINGVGQLPINYDHSSYIEFIQEFGTHFIIKSTMGSRWGLISRFSNISWYQMSSSNFDIKLGATFSAMFKAGVPITDFQKKYEEFFLKYSSEQLIFETGESFPENLNESIWVEQSKKNPMPLKITLKSLDNLLNTNFFPKDIHIEQKRKNLKKVMDNYCNYLLKNKIVNSCNGPLPDPPLPLPSNFGGMFQKDDKGQKNIPNPYTGDQNCMKGYTAYNISEFLTGSGNGTAKQYICISNLNFKPNGIYGGSYSIWYNSDINKQFVNPFTGDCICPSGYTVKKTAITKTEDNHKVENFICLKMDVSVDKEIMAGLFQIGKQINISNPFTNSENCPNGYKKYIVGYMRNPNYDSPTNQYICLNNVFQ